MLNLRSLLMSTYLFELCSIYRSIYWPPLWFMFNLLYYLSICYMHLLYAKFVIFKIINTYLTYAKITIVIKSEIISLMLNIPCYLINLLSFLSRTYFIFMLKLLSYSVNTFLIYVKPISYLISNYFIYANHANLFHENSS